MSIWVKLNDLYSNPVYLATPIYAVHAGPPAYQSGPEQLGESVVFNAAGSFQVQGSTDAVIAAIKAQGG